MTLLRVAEGEGWKEMKKSHLPEMGSQTLGMAEHRSSRARSRGLALNALWQMSHLCHREFILSILAGAHQNLEDGKMFTQTFLGHTVSQDVTGRLCLCLAMSPGGAGRNAQIAAVFRTQRTQQRKRRHQPDGEPSDKSLP